MEAASSSLPPDPTMKKATGGDLRVSSFARDLEPWASSLAPGAGEGQLNEPRKVVEISSVVLQLSYLVFFSSTQYSFRRLIGWGARRG